MRAPDGAGDVYEVKGGELLFDETSSAGIYRYARQDPFGESHRFFAVTLADEAESDIVPRALPPPSASATARESRTARSVAALWPWLAMAALLLLALEWWLGGHAAREGPRTRAGAA